MPPAVAAAGAIPGVPESPCAQDIFGSLRAQMPNKSGRAACGGVQDEPLALDQGLPTHRGEGSCVTVED